MPSWDEATMWTKIHNRPFKQKFLDAFVRYPFSGFQNIITLCVMMLSLYLSVDILLIPLDERPNELFIVQGLLGFAAVAMVWFLFQERACYNEWLEDRYAEWKVWDVPGGEFFDERQVV